MNWAFEFFNRKSFYIFFISLALFPFFSKAESLTNVAGVTFQQFPVDRQLYPRNVFSNRANIVIAGEVQSWSGHNGVKVVLRQNGVILQEFNRTLNYSAGRASFNFNIEIEAGLTNYDFEFYGTNDNQQTLERTVSEVVVGDVYIINGQSNAQARAAAHPDDLHPFLRSYNDEWGWNLINFSFPGEWGARIGRQIIEEQGIPVAIFNEAEGSRKIDYFLRNDSNITAGNYGRLFNRLTQAGVRENVRAAFWFQGETDGWQTSIEQYKAAFTDLFTDWSNDYNIENAYLFQLRYESCTHPRPDVLEAQRQIADELNDVAILSSNNAIHDGCHFDYYGGYQVLGDRMYRLMSRDLYGGTSFEVASPDIVSAALNNNSLVIQVSETNALASVGYPWADFVLEGNSNAFIIGGSVSGNQITLQLNGNTDGISGISYLGHSGGANDWITNSVGVGILSFFNAEVDNSSGNNDPGDGGSEMVDLELSFTTENAEYEIYDFVNLQITVSNKGSVNAQNVVVKYVLPEVLAFSETDGDYSSWNNLWRVGTVAAGGSHTLNLRLFTLTENEEIENFAQVNEMDQQDVDSSPGNDNNNVADEDDEALLVLGQVDNNDSDSGGGDHGGDPGDDPVSNGVDLELNLSTNSDGFEIYKHVLISLQVQNKGDQTATNIEIDVPIPNLTSYSDHSTERGNYSAWNGQWKLDELGAGESITLELDLFTLTGNEDLNLYAEVAEMDQPDMDSSPGNGGGDVSEDDETLLILSPDGGTSGGGGGGDPEPQNGVDLTLSIVADKNDFIIYEDLIFTLTLENNGNETASDVEVEFPIPNDVSYVNHSVSEGDYNAWREVWRVGTLAPGETRIMELTLFTLTEDGSLTFFAQVSSLAETDIDSSPDNASPGNVSEDDEVSLTLDNAAGLRSLPEASVVQIDQFRRLTVSEVFPNPSTDQVNLRITSNTEMVTQLQIFNARGTLVNNAKIDIEEGFNEVELNIMDYPTGLYFVLFETGTKHDPIYFVKQRL